MLTCSNPGALDSHFLSASIPPVEELTNMDWLWIYRYRIKG